jgi:hypothetical protein
VLGVAAFGRLYLTHAPDYRHAGEITLAMVAFTALITTIPAARLRRD